MSVPALQLLAALFSAHFLGDFTPLANDRMQRAKASGGPMRHIAAHAGVHSLLVGLAVATLARPGAALVGGAVAVQFVTHFLLDAFRSRLAARAPALRDPTRGVFWSALGLDQLAHGLVLLAIAWMVL